MLHPASAEQQRCIDALIDGGRNVVVKAQAGAGKSTTFLHTAKAWVEHHGGKVVLLCYNVNLRAASEKRVEELGLSEHIHCYTIHSLASQIHQTSIGDTLSLLAHLECTGVAPDDYTLCLIDEGQDLSRSMVAVINQLQQLLGGKMRYMVVGDLRQAIYDFAREAEPEVLVKPAEVLEPNGCAWEECMLNESYRVTPAIAAFLNEHYRHPTNEPIVGANTHSRNVPPEVVVGDAAKGDLVRLVSALLQEYDPEQIMVLAPSVRAKDYQCRELAKLLSEHHKVPLHTTHRRLVEVNQALLKGKLVISTYHQSKGDERDCVVVLGSDLRLFTRRGGPVLDGRPLVDNALHVALTRARERLVVFQAFDHRAYPSIIPETLASLAKVTVYTAPLAEPRKVAPPKMSKIERGVGWLVEFASEESIEVLRRLAKVADGVRMGKPALDRPEPIVRMVDGRVEEVAGYFPAAVVGAAHRSWLFNAYRRATATSKLEDDVRCDTRDARVLPGLYRPFVEQVVQPRRQPDGPRGWLTLSVLHEAICTHQFSHVLRQITDFDWLDEPSARFFMQCVENMNHITRKNPHNDFFARYRRESGETRTRITAKILYMTMDDGLHTPWVLSFDDRPSESDLLHAVVYMWLAWCRHAVIHCMPTNTLFRVKVESKEELEEFITRLIVAKRRLQMETCDDPDIVDLLARFAATSEAIRIHPSCPAQRSSAKKPDDEALE